ncbi:MAG: amidophosphoribosyltransferase [Ignisphaera sp.]
MTGLLAIYAFDDMWSLGPYVRYGLMSLQHRGAENYVVCISEGDVKCYTANNIDNVSEHITTNKVIAATYSNRDEALYIHKEDGLNIAVLADIPSAVLEEVAKELSRALKKDGTVKGVTRALEDFGAKEYIPSFIAITNRGDIIVWRSVSGLTPLVLGGYGFDMAIVSSETTAIDILGADTRKFLLPGEGLLISRYLLTKFNTASATNPRLCLFEILYLARHDAIVDNVSVYGFRKSLGKELGKRFNRDVDVVVGVPETAIPYAIGFSQAINKPFELAFIATGGRVRSMLRFDPREKLIAIHLKMNPIRQSLEGKKVAIVDDSMVTGSTIKTISQILRYRVGVDEIHLLIASPPLISTCPYNIMKLDMESLLAANLSKEMALKYLEVDSLSWLQPEVIDSVAKMYRLKLCGKCFGYEFFG